MKAVSNEYHIWEGKVCRKCHGEKRQGSWGPMTSDSYCTVVNVTGVEMTLAELVGVVGAERATQVLEPLLNEKRILLAPLS